MTKERISRMKILKKRLDVFGNRSMGNLRSRPKSNIEDKFIKPNILASSALISQNIRSKSKMHWEKNWKNEISSHNYNQSFKLGSGFSNKIEGAQIFLPKEDSGDHLKEYSVLEPIMNEENFDANEFPKQESKCLSSFIEDDSMDKSLSSDSLTNSDAPTPLSTSKLYF